MSQPKLSQLIVAAAIAATSTGAATTLANAAQSAALANDATPHLPRLSVAAAASAYIAMAATSAIAVGTLTAEATALPAADNLCHRSHDLGRRG